MRGKGGRGRSRRIYNIVYMEHNLDNIPEILRVAPDLEHSGRGMGRSRG